MYIIHNISCIATSLPYALSGGVLDDFPSTRKFLPPIPSPSLIGPP